MLLLSVTRLVHINKLQQCLLPVERLHSDLPQYVSVRGKATGVLACVAQERRLPGVRQPRLDFVEYGFKARVRPLALFKINWPVGGRHQI